jgi:hypothetical protein
MRASVRHGLATALAVVLCGAPAAGAAAKPVTHSAILVQSAAGATLWAPAADGTRELVLTGTDPEVLAIADRPTRASGDLTPRQYAVLWRRTFRNDPPNAALTGTTATGGRVRVPVVLRSMVRRGGTVRYRVRALQRTPALALTDVSLLIDNALVQLDSEEATVVAPDVVVVRPGDPLEISCQSPTALYLYFGQLMLDPGAALAFSDLDVLRMIASVTQPASSTLQAAFGGPSPNPAVTLAAQSLAGRWLWITNPIQGASQLALTAGQMTVLTSVEIECY